MFYRVQDEESATEYSPEDGFQAQNQRLSPMGFSRMLWLACYVEARNDDEASTNRHFWNLLRYLLIRHLRWGSPEPSPFISVYSSRAIAEANAKLRLRQGRTCVSIAEIEVQPNKGVQFRSVRRLAGLLRVEMNNAVWSNSKSEFVFVRRIPADWVTDIYSVED